MKPADQAAFFKMLDDTYDMIGKSPAAKIISPTAKALFFTDLQRYPLDLIAAALSAHRMDADRGRFTPTVADISSQIERRRPLQWVGPDEAWATVPKIEGEPGIMNQVTAKALAAAQPLLDEGDTIAARMAFKNCYDRLVARAKLDRVNPEYFLSPGGSMEDQQALREEGQRQGLLPAPDAAPMLELGGSPTKAGRAALTALKLDFKPKTMPEPEASDYE
jgi:hypothetical protein